MKLNLPKPQDVYMNCRICEKLMFGIMKISGINTPRKVCWDCGGKIDNCRK